MGDLKKIRNALRRETALDDRALSHAWNHTGYGKNKGRNMGCGGFKLRAKIRKQGRRADKSNYRLRAR